jgi:ribosomal small subunit protein bTHX
MGRGDKKTKKGKIARGSYGKTRKRKTSAPIIASIKPKKKVAPKNVEDTEAVVKPVAKKAAAAKKPAAEKKPAAVKKPAAEKKPAAAKKATTKTTSKKED